jgi:hypothetical protein
LGIKVSRAKPNRKFRTARSDHFARRRRRLLLLLLLRLAQQRSIDELRALGRLVAHKLVISILLWSCRAKAYFQRRAPCSG